jgi:hypothetical protein
MQHMQNLRLAAMLRQLRWPKHPTPAGAFWIAFVIATVLVALMIVDYVTRAFAS